MTEQQNITNRRNWFVWAVLAMCWWCAVYCVFVLFGISRVDGKCASAQCCGRETRICVRSQMFLAIARVDVLLFLL